MATHQKPTIGPWRFLLFFPHFWQCKPSKMALIIISLFGDISPVKKKAALD
jgi:hypothetical protein